MKITKREKIMLALMGIALLGFLYYQFVFKSESSTIKKLKVEYNDKTALLQRVKSSDERLEAIDKEIAGLQSEIDVKKMKISEPLRLPEVLAELNTAAAQRALKISSVSFSGDAAVKGEFKSSAMNGMTDANAQAAALKGDQPSDTAAPAETVTQAKKGMKTLTVALDFSGSYESCLSLIKYYESNKRLYVVKEFEIRTNAGSCMGMLTYDTLTTAEDPSGFLYNAGTDAGPVRTNPFK